MSFAIYTSNRQTFASYDSASNSLLAFNLLQNHRLDFDAFRGSYFTALGGQYTFEEAANGHLASAYPVGTAILTLPIYAVFSLARNGGTHLPPLSSPDFEPLRLGYEKTAAAVIVAVSVGLFLLCALEIARATGAIIATTVYALATSMWSIASQALWQHGPVNLTVLAMAYALFRAGRARVPTCVTRWLVAAGVCAGFLTVIRPTAALFSIAGLIFVLWSFRAHTVAFLIAFGLGAAPGVAWNAYFFHSLLGGYGGMVPMSTVYILTPSHVGAALAGLFFSPSRGILVFSPILAFGVLGAVRAWRIRDRNAVVVLLLACACAALTAQYAVFAYWWAGFTYGPRYFCDTASVAALFVAYAIPRNVPAYVRRTPVTGVTAAIFLLLTWYSVGVQFVGPNSGAAGSEWNAVPISVNRDPDRVWPIADNQIERNVRAAYYLFFNWNVARSSEYERGVAVHVLTLAPSFAQVGRGAAVDATAMLRNDGKSIIYGYNTGVYVGQLRVVVRIIDANKQLASEQFLYVNGSPAPGEHATALGTITVPSKPGRYLLECTPVLVGGGPLLKPATPLRVALTVT